MAQTDKQRGNGHAIDEVRRGAVKATIWQNESSRGTFYKVTFQKLYKKGEEWKSTQGFSEEDLGNVARVAVLLEDWFALQRERSAGSDSQESD